MKSSSRSMVGVSNSTDLRNSSNSASSSSRKGISRQRLNHGRCRIMSVQALTVPASMKLPADCEYSLQASPNTWKSENRLHATYSLPATSSLTLNSASSPESSCTSLSPSITQAVLITPSFSSKLLQDMGAFLSSTSHITVRLEEQREAQFMPMALEEGEELPELSLLSSDAISVSSWERSSSISSKQKPQSSSSSILKEFIVLWVCFTSLMLTSGASAETS
mmetsp:Transcript_16596/g.36797  ORF Transcript_16596/g.36797 Transcript_16596/m.36797 type:complete len:222 (+) Transcript_16596:204-869(+)